MACLHPLKAIRIGINTKTGKDAYRIVPYTWEDPTNTYEVIEIPCGTCVGCRKQHAYEWQQRAVAELQGYEKASFLTLTYDDAHLPLNRDGAATLKYKDFQDFVKRLRKYHPDDDIRYFGCGEYGSQTMRPHYHVIIYGYEFPDRKFLKVTKKDSMIYTSKELENLWKLGMSSVGDVNAATCGYVAGYISSKIGKYSNMRYRDLDIMPPKLFASRRPALGRRWFEAHVKDFMSTDVQFVATESGSYGIGLTKYYIGLIDKLQPEWYNQIKDSRRVKAEYVHDTKQAQTDKDYLSQLESKEVNMLAAVKAHRREV